MIMTETEVRNKMPGAERKSTAAGLSGAKCWVFLTFYSACMDKPTAAGDGADQLLIAGLMFDSVSCVNARPHEGLLG